MDLRQVLQVKASVDRRDRLFRDVREEREMQHVGMEVDDVELVGGLPDARQHGHVSGEVGLQRRGVQPYGAIADGHQPRRRLRLRAGEQGDVVPEGDEGVGEGGHHALRAAVEVGWHGLIERRNLRDLHDGSGRVTDVADLRI
jgi:hypothetical protein